MDKTHHLPALPYDAGALEPYIDARTMQLHHGEHHAAYVEELNATLAPYPELQSKSALWLLLNLRELPAEIRVAVRASAGGHVNHGLFWQAMSPDGGGVPKGLLGDAIARDFGSYGRFQTRFDEAGAALRGCGWVWLARALEKGGRLEVLTTSAHDNPLMHGRFPLLLNDLWEHAYYLQHENRRLDYLNGWWPVVNWEQAARRYERSEHSIRETSPAFEPGAR
ncbi:MAG TPA: superoxide dismutase [Burkholderiales bacterium]|nr:superoxide dismutase [Burkholderiales bacterium]